MRSLFALILSVTPLWAGETASRNGDIPVEEWRELALGKTLTYRIGEEFFALERYAPSGNRVDLQLNTGECLAGTWSHVGNSYCFDWGDDRAACFRHVRTGDAIAIIQMDNGVETNNIQHMTNISEAPLSCGQNMS